MVLKLIEIYTDNMLSKLLDPPRLLSSGYCGMFPLEGVKGLGSEAGHSIPSSAEVKNGVAIPPLPHMLCGIVLN
jgi:hypothetical protein